MSRFEMSAATIRSRCERVASIPGAYDFPGRLRTCEQYLALIRLFSRLNFNDDEDMLAGGLAVYGWMPTMLGGLTAREELKALLADLSNVNGDQAARILEQHRASGALRAVNNSIVGTSKLLHFFLPNKIPIWDSVLGKSFGLEHHHQFHREDRFITYAQTIHEVIQSPGFLCEKLDIATGRSGDDVSSVRRLEFALYAFGRRHAGANGAASDKPAKSMPD